MRDVVVDIPNAWSAEDLALLDGLDGDWLVHTERYRECPAMGTAPITDPLAMRALMLYVSRAGPLGMQPVFDIFNHGHNSTRHHVDNGAHVFFAVRSHSVGEELFNTFAMGAAAGKRMMVEMRRSGSEPASANDFFQNYGFMEPPPVAWEFAASSTGERFSFTIEDAADQSGSVVPLQLLDEWSGIASGEAPSPDARKHLEALAEGASKEVSRLEERRLAYHKFGLHCAAALLEGQGGGDSLAVGVGAHGETGEPKRAHSPDRQRDEALCGHITSRQMLAVKYRRAYVAALRAAAASAERVLEGAAHAPL